MIHAHSKEFIALEIYCDPFVGIRAEIELQRAPKKTVAHVDWNKINRFQSRVGKDRPSPRSSALEQF